MAAPLEPEAAGEEAHHNVLDDVLFAQRLEAPRPHRSAHTQKTQLQCSLFSPVNLEKQPPYSQGSG